MSELTEEQKTEICDLYKSGLKVLDVRNCVGRKMQTVQRVLREAGVMRRKGKERLPDRKCWICQKRQPWENFVKDRSRSTGYSFTCVSCSNEYVTHQRLRRLGFTKERITEIWNERGCAICGRKDRQPVIDHSHVTNKVRGILCTQCNSGLGFLSDDPEVLEKAADYLRQHNQQGG